MMPFARISSENDMSCHFCQKGINSSASQLIPAHLRTFLGAIFMISNNNDEYRPYLEANITDECKWCNSCRCLCDRKCVVLKSSIENSAVLPVIPELDDRVIAFIVSELRTCGFISLRMISSRFCDILPLPTITSFKDLLLDRLKWLELGSIKFLRYHNSAILQCDDVILKLVGLPLPYVNWKIQG